MSTINTSSGSMLALRHMRQGERAIAASMEKLATGSRINRGADDPAGLVASEDLRAALEVLDAETRGIERTDAVANVAEGALAEMSSLMNDANAAAVAMANTGGMSQAERDAYQMEIDSARQSMERIAATTTFNGQHVLDGSMTLRSGDASVELERMAPGDDAGSMAEARERIAMLRGEIGSFQKNTLGGRARSAAVEYENTAAAESMIRDTDYGAETAVLARELSLADARRMLAALQRRSAGDVLRLLS